MTGRPNLIAPGISLAILSAVLFGASMPFAKLLLGTGVNPWILASLLYLGSGAGLALVHLGRGAIRSGSAGRRWLVPICHGSHL